jgi:hypothetical protein
MIVFMFSFFYQPAYSRSQLDRYYQHKAAQEAISSARKRAASDVRKKCREAQGRGFDGFIRKLTRCTLTATAADRYGDGTWRALKRQDQSKKRIVRYLAKQNRKNYRQDCRDARSGFLSDAGCWLRSLDKSRYGRSRQVPSTGRFRDFNQLKHSQRHTGNQLRPHY